MEVKLAKTAGFCFGVTRAVEAVYEQAAKGNGEPIYTFGPIIHNEEVVRDLEEKGVQVVNDIGVLSSIPKGTVVIRSHGVGKKVYDAIRESGMECVDATCPFVKKIHKIVSEASENGQIVIIMGNDKHPEVEGIKGWCKTPVYVVQTVEEAEKLEFPEGTKLCIVAQTTFNYKKFKDLVEIFEKKRYDRYAYNTICDATHKRQMEAKQIAAEADAMIVIGGKSSSNTQKLFEICREECANTYYIQTLGDLDMQSIQTHSCVGITAGASTPQKIIEEVLFECQKQALKSY